MSPAGNHGFATDYHRVDSGLSGHEHVRIQPTIARDRSHVRVRRVEHHEIGAMTDVNRTDAPADIQPPTRERVLVESAACRSALPLTQHIARAVPEALAVLELFEFRGRAEFNV